MLPYTLRMYQGAGSFALRVSFLKRGRETLWGEEREREREREREILSG